MGEVKSLKRLFSYIKWLLHSKPMIKYEGFNCGCCGRWWSISFELPQYQSGGVWWDTWGLCPKGKGCW